MLPEVSGCSVSVCSSSLSFYDNSYLFSAGARLGQSIGATDLIHNGISREQMIRESRTNHAAF
jgi:hypothetical protein